MTLSITTFSITQFSITQFSIMAEHCSECLLCSLSLMLSVTYKPFMLSVIMLNVVMLSVIMLSVVAPYEDNDDSVPLEWRTIRSSTTLVGLKSGSKILD
jgi:hypothetical protein